MRRIFKILVAVLLFAAVHINVYAYKNYGELVAESRFDGWDTYTVDGNSNMAVEVTYDNKRGGEKALVIHRENTAKTLPVRIYNTVSVSNYGVGMEVYTSEKDTNLKLYYSDDLGAMYYPEAKYENEGAWYRLSAVGYVQPGRKITRVGIEYLNKSAAEGNVYLDDFLVKIAPKDIYIDTTLLKNTNCIALDNIKVFAYDIFGERRRLTEDEKVSWEALKGEIENGVAYADEASGELALIGSIGGVSKECRFVFYNDITLTPVENGVRVKNNTEEDISCFVVCKAVKDSKASSFKAIKCEIGKSAYIDLDFSELLSDGAELKYFIVK